MTDWFKVLRFIRNRLFKKTLFCKVANLVLCEAQRQLAYADKGSASADKCAQDYIH